MFRAINGEHARRAAGWVVIQDAGQTDDGRPIYCVVGVLVGGCGTKREKADARNVHGELTIRPQAAYVGNRYRGCGSGHPDQGCSCTRELGQTADMKPFGVAGSR